MECTFNNNTGKQVRLEMMSSAALDNLSPLNHDNDHSEDIYLHTFKSSWALEGTHNCKNLRELNLQKAWGGTYESLKIGTQGSRSTADYFPYAVAEDRKAGVMWGMKLAHNATWQIEFTRCAYDMSLSCGIGDLSYGCWFKDIENGGSFTAPKAYVAMCEGYIADMSIMFNDWCTTWGHPTHENMMKIADKLQESKVKYIIADDGWFKSDRKR